MVARGAISQPITHKSISFLVILIAVLPLPSSNSVEFASFLLPLMLCKKHQAQALFPSILIFILLYLSCQVTCFFFILRYHTIDVYILQSVVFLLQRDFLFSLTSLLYLSTVTRSKLHQDLHFLLFSLGMYFFWQLHVQVLLRVVLMILK